MFGTHGAVRKSALNWFTTVTIRSLIMISLSDCSRTLPTGNQRVKTQGHTCPSGATARLPWAQPTTQYRRVRLGLCGSTATHSAKVVVADFAELQGAELVACLIASLGLQNPDDTGVQGDTTTLGPR